MEAVITKHFYAFELIPVEMSVERTQGRVKVIPLPLKTWIQEWDYDSHAFSWVHGRRRG